MSSSATIPAIANHSPEWKFGFFPQLDGFRGLSILLVLIGHTVYPAWGRLGGLGVMMFFVLSGFLITGLLCKEHVATGTISLKQFYLRRALRILPAFFALIAVMVVLIKLRFVTDVPWYTVAVACLYLSDIFGRGESMGHLWSLSLEEQFYTGWPLIMRTLGLRRSLWFACGSVVGIMAFRGTAIRLQLFDYFSAAFYERPWFRFDSILIGCCIALFLYYRQPSTTVMKRWATVLTPAVIFPVLILWTMFAEDPVALRPFYLTVQLLLATTILFHVVVLPAGTVSRCLANPPLRFLGKISYSVYLWQQIFLITRQPDWGVLRVFPFNIACVLVAGVASHYLIERPFLKLKHNWSASRTKSTRASSLVVPQPEPADATS